MTGGGGGGGGIGNSYNFNIPFKSTFFFEVVNIITEYINITITINNIIIKLLGSYVTLSFGTNELKNPDILSLAYSNVFFFSITSFKSSSENLSLLQL